MLSYAASRPDWRLRAGAFRSYLETWIDDNPDAEDTQSEPDGAIGLFGHDTGCEAMPYPRVNVSDRLDAWCGARVTVDNHAAGRQAAEHLLAQGCEAFAFVGPLHLRMARRRYEGFAARIHEAGGDVHLCPQERQVPEAALIPRDWLAALPHPLGMLCYTDRCGYRTTLAAQAAGLSVPEDVAMVGVDNDELVCRAVRPELSSVALPLEAIGKRAAALLDALLHGEPIPATPIELPPIGVEARESSRFRGVDDPLVRRVVAYMREHLHEGIDVARVVEESGVSRRTLEYRFRDAMGCTPHAELKRLQCQLAGDLLRTTALPLEGVAERCGFASASALSDTFTKHMGQRPGAYRRQFTG